MSVDNFVGTLAYDRSVSVCDVIKKSEVCVAFGHRRITCCRRLRLRR